MNDKIENSTCCRLRVAFRDDSEDTFVRNNKALLSTKNLCN